MDILNQLTSVVTKGSRRVGRGIGSKKGGHTTGKGAKGDKVRGKTRITFDGTKIKKSWIKRLPFLRGKHRLLSQGKLPIVKLFDIERLFKANDVVDAKVLSKKIGVTSPNFKILSQGKLTKVLTFKGLQISSKAKAKIESIGGKIE